MANKEEQYKTTMYIDLISFLMSMLLLNESNDKNEVVKKILRAWVIRNKKMVRYSLRKELDSIISKDIKLVERQDEISILLSTQELIFNSIRNDLIDTLTKGITISEGTKTNVNTSFNKQKEKP